MEQTLVVVNYLPAFHFLHNPTVQGTFIFFVAASLISKFVALAFLFSSTKETKWPPSPPRLPLLGNLHQLSKGGNLLSTLTDMAKTYGPVITVWMGPSPLVVLTGQAPIWEALVNQAINFSGRPSPYSRQFTSASFRTMISSPYNEHWTKLRKVLHNNVLSPVHVVLQSSSHQEAANKLINKLEKEMKEKNGVVRPFHGLKMMGMSFMAHLCFGLDFQDENFLSKLEEFIEEDINLTKDADVFLDSFPPARFFVPSSIRTERKWKSLRADVLRLLVPLIRFARSYREYFKRSAPSSFLNCLLSIDEGEEGEDKSKLSDEEIAFSMYELCLLAVDSTSTAIEWALAYLITNPRVQERAYHEISQAAQEGKGRLFGLEDLRKLPYLQSVVKETLRKESIAPLGVIHQTQKECKVMGIIIPAKSAVLFNLHSVSNDPEVWEETEEFRPERFLGNNEVRMSYLPFGAGRRVCAGMDVASVYVPITLANLLKAFEWGCVKEGSPPDLTRDITNVLMSMKYPLEARITPRPS
ncbi:hypothetical protein SUGI_0764510 [Cryptomeria japonica]|uniref:(S)-canadine synthase CYP719A21-like n=1 Tax=Cryptomeria japonica TaxID=3369 RepID=UPI002414876C|nr:(S)-canadine synthase CYP719A21-like [Cryptomeria japonica]GLJ37637.1 hypothetical protein SUGI_0764510 [Cryptomeria japonica]